MKIFLLSIIVFTLFSCSKNSNLNYPELPSDISKYPKEIAVHAVGGGVSYMERNYADDSLPYVWEHKVSISCSKESIEILEFGSFILDGDEWFSTTRDGKPYDAMLFEEWFDCPNSILEPGKVYTSDRFRNIGNLLPDRPIVIRWYFIGLSGEDKVRGEVTLIDDVK